MTRWTRAGRGVRCGACDAPIASGEPVARFEIAGLRRVLLRCVACAGEAVPCDLPAPVVTIGPTPTPIARMTRVQAIRTGIDWKQRAYVGDE